MNESIEELLASGAVVPDRPGSKRLVPAAQSVVVPVDRGVAGVIMDGLWPILGGNHTDAEVWTEIGEVVSSALAAVPARCVAAALSPEAPAREGVMHPDAQPFERFPELALHIERMAMTGLVGSGISWDAFLRELNAALTPRHEAPASEVPPHPSDEYDFHVAYSEAFDEANDAGYGRGHAHAAGVKAGLIAVRGHEAPAEDDDGPCTCCDDTGITIQTERPCACAAGIPFEAPAETITSAELIANTDYARGAVRVPGETEDRRIYGQPEAPAEGAGDAWIVHDGKENPAPGQRVDVKMTFTTFNDIDADTFDWNGRCHWRRSATALRARSSAPEAREEALGNLLAVIHGDGGHRALEVGTKQAALEAEKIVAGLFAAPSADKLRIAVEALNEARENLIQCGDHFGAGQCADAVSLIAPPDALKGDAKP